MAARRTARTRAHHRQRGERLDRPPERLRGVFVLGGRPRVGRARRKDAAPRVGVGQVAGHLGPPGVEANAVRCPETLKVLAAVPQPEMRGRTPSAMFSLLQPKTRIPPHTGVTNARLVAHLPLIVPEGCGFRVGGETRPWIEGKPFAFDDTIEPEAWTDSDHLRSVLIFDVWNPHLTERERELIARYYEAADAAGYSPQRTE